MRASGPEPSLDGLPGAIHERGASREQFEQFERAPGATERLVHRVRLVRRDHTRLASDPIEEFGASREELGLTVAAASGRHGAVC